MVVTAENIIWLPKETSDDDILVSCGLSPNTYKIIDTPPSADGRHKPETTPHRLLLYFDDRGIIKIYSQAQNALGNTFITSIGSDDDRTRFSKVGILPWGEPTWYFRIFGAMRIRKIVEISGMMNNMGSGLIKILAKKYVKTWIRTLAELIIYRNEGKRLRVAIERMCHLNLIWECLDNLKQCSLLYSGEYKAG
ncbi:uncharacterized protein PV09_07590 [Verruconis gallopava]|uniref:Uncharacterized protein n=1 Tax=Verruconis gallopava TaxID=253628 RepID=A0A0D2A364_9PEZI|nr:uncharacterized protein PV09_07590 [Verruconis gallopava]KIW00830.1 hypothetical protein PV09_07590 [Verruconis gallopava]